MKYFFPGCRIKNGYPVSSERLRQYMRYVWHLEAEGCCKENYQKLEDGSTAVLICNNCAHDIREKVSNPNFEYVYDIINNDPTFAFPNYHGKKMYLQHCHHGFDNVDMRPTICSLLKKMNIEYIELKAEVPSNLDKQAHREICISNSQIVKQDEVITYCAICNLAYKKQGTNTHYLLDLLFAL